jgi:phage I-like protein
VLSKGISHVTVVRALSAATSELLALASVVEAKADGEKPVQLRVLPIGTFEARGHGIMLKVADLVAAQAVIDATRKRHGKTDIMADWDHQSIFGAKDGVGGKAPAAGWIDPATLVALAEGPEGPGIYADVAWTAEGAADIAAKRYRYLSPLIAHTKDGTVTRLQNIALTNTPAIDDLTTLKLAASLNHNPKQEPIMELATLAALLGLAATATEAEVSAALTAQLEERTTLQASLTALRQAAGIADGQDAVAALTALKATSAGSEATTELLKTLTQQVSALTAGGNEAYLNAAVAAGKITPALKEKYLPLMATNEKMVREIIDAAPVILQPTDLGGRKVAESEIALTAEMRDVARLAGIPEDKVLATLKAEHAAKEA